MSDLKLSVFGLFVIDREVSTLRRHFTDSQEDVAAAIEGGNQQVFVTAASKGHVSLIQCLLLLVNLNNPVF